MHLMAAPGRDDDDTEGHHSQAAADVNGAVSTSVNTTLFNTVTADVVNSHVK